MRATSIRRFQHIPAPSRQRGMALFVGLVFLVVLSLVAVIAMQSTFLEMRMATNVARHEEAFQMSDSMRGALGPFLEANLLTGGWPVSWGGTAPDSQFDWSSVCPNASLPVTAANCPLVNTFKTAIAGATTPFKQITGPLDPGEQPYDPSTWVTDFTLTQANPNGIGKIAASISLVPDGIVPNQGSGTAQAAGYRGLGVSTAAGGFAKFFEVQAIGLSPSDGSNGRAVTIAQYRTVTR
ncbi:MAG TPA: PilX N-terminal domain-containing pilus assembly protein [Rhodanobacteraceae bacterium]|nr:PilX N-terminal domain-containing pilus assembly protein [Rhodanobacteraceae bacterium]